MNAAAKNALHILEPRPVWAHFATLCATPRPSKEEGALVQLLIDWARHRHLDVQRDQAGNLLIRKRAKKGYEHLPATVLQAHLDMVCQSDDPSYDKARDPIKPHIADGWVVAERTTLGADNGIGVALILAALEDDALAHGPLEALLTVDEEAGMGGARGLEANFLRGERLLNLDTETWGDFYMGCAGGMDVNISRPGLPEALADDWEAWQIDIKGLKGGHSGVDIHEGRANAIKLMASTLRQLDGGMPFRLLSLTGGSARNAIPRQATACIALPAGLSAKLRQRLAEIQGGFVSTFADIDEGIRLSAHPISGGAQCLAEEEKRFWIRAIDKAPYGVWRWSDAVPGTVETSNNIGTLTVSTTGGECNFMVRSMIDGRSTELADLIGRGFAEEGKTVIDFSGHYPGWRPDPASPLLRECQAAFKALFGEDSEIKVIHAGLECGLIGAKYPGMDIVSFGPSIRGAHAPGESVEIESVGKTWALLKAILEGRGCRS